jgi:thiol-disulfide isomerase/thioredoxin
MTRIVQTSTAKCRLFRTVLILAIAVPVLFSGLPGVSFSAHADDDVVLKIGAPAPDFSFTDLDGSDYKLSQFRGKPVMLWFFASWCPTCIGSTKMVSQRFEELTANGMQIIQLRLYNNLGYSGPSAGQFAETYAGATGELPNWLWGEASLEASVTYDPRGYPDIYFLIDREGVLRGANGAPNVSMNDILDFAGKS